jgi:acyl-CoA synthetase (AMP-forming)/AMP-acid ligase II/NAD(P)-dependent dehydrogenase (short-subunit alcohol dehydrogenase family)
LVAFVVTAGPFDEATIRRHAAAHRPPSRMPDVIVPMWALPMTEDGRVDEAALSQIAVVDDRTIADISRRLRIAPGFENAVVVPCERRPTAPPIHVSDLMPKFTVIAPEPRRQAAPADPLPVRIDGATNPIGAVPSVVSGPVLNPAAVPRNLSAALDRAVDTSPDLEIICIDADGAQRARCYVDLARTAERIVGGLRIAGFEPGSRFLLQLGDNEDFIDAFWGCQLGGYVPVPLACVASHATPEGVAKLRAAWQLLGRPAILTDTVHEAGIRTLVDNGELAGACLIVLERLRLADPDRHRSEAQPDDVALILLTSGSTGIPKGVPQTHRALLSQAAGSCVLNAFSTDDVSLNWMPLDHVGGIVMFHLRDVVAACKQIHVATECVLRDPLLWLDLIERFSATITWAPNFAFGLVNSRADAVRSRRWDLSSMRFILNGGESIVARTARTFLQLLQIHGLPASAMHPAWGMSETSSGVTYSDRFSVATTSDTDALVEVGEPIPGFAIRIVDTNGAVVPENTIGRLQVRGPSVTRGYLAASDLNRQLFHDGWFDTGDLGVLRSGQLTITGREKEVVIVNGVNYSAHEIEAAVEEVPGVVVSYTAACAVRLEHADTDRVVVFFSPLRDDEHDLAALLGEIRRRVAARVGINPDFLVPVPAAAIPKTAIGKIQRSLLAERFAAGQFDAAVKRIDLLTANSRTLPNWFFSRVWTQREPRTVRQTSRGDACLVFARTTGIGGAIAGRLSADDRPVVVVEPGAGFERLSSGHYRISPAAPADYQRLLAALSADRRWPRQVVHTWAVEGLDTDFADGASLLHQQAFGSMSVLCLARALALTQERAGELDVVVVTRSMQAVSDADPPCWVHGGLPGLMKSTAQELPGVHCRLIDLPMAAVDEHLPLLMHELTEEYAEAEVALRAGRRWVSRLKPVALDGSADRERPFLKQGRYLLSGGLGGIGGKVAAYLLREFAARLLVVGRTNVMVAPAAPAEAARSDRRQTYLELTKLPGDIVYEPVDVADLSGMRRAVKQAEARWAGRLNGVIHLAGHYEERALADESPETLAAMLRPKLLGAWTLAKVVEDTTDPLFVSFSSLGGRFGGALIGAYATANSSLEAFSRHLRRTRGFRSHCLEWGTWNDLGVSHRYGRKELVIHSGYTPMSVQQGLWSLEGALSHGLCHALIGLNASHDRALTSSAIAAPRRGVRIEVPSGAAWSHALATLDLRDRFGTPIDSQLSAGRPAGQELAPSSSKTPGPGEVLRQQRKQPTSELELALAGYWREVLAVTDCDVDDDFFALGGNSLFATQVASRLEADYAIRVPLRVMLEATTLGDLAKRVEQLLGDRSRSASGPPVSASDRAAGLLDRLDQLSDEEVSALLDETLARRQGR